MRKNIHNHKQQNRKVKYIQISKRQDIYAIFYPKSNLLCMNTCFEGTVKLIVLQQEEQGK